jgi:hypothetical protein
MFFDDNNPPHFRARYAENKVAIEIESFRILESSIPPWALGLVIEWASQHKDELLNSWEAVHRFCRDSRYGRRGEGFPRVGVRG